MPNASSYRFFVCVVSSCFNLQEAHKAGLERAKDFLTKRNGQGQQNQFAKVRSRPTGQRVEEPGLRTVPHA